MRWRFWTLLVLALAFLFPALQLPVHAAGVVGTGTAASCTEAALDGALAGGGSISFNCGTLPFRIMLTHEKEISTNTSIDGGALITLSGANRSRILKVNAGITLELKKIRLANGAANDLTEDGSAITSPHSGSGGAVTLIDSTLTNNRADQSGAAILNDRGTLSILRSTLSQNDAGDNGAGLLNLNGTVTITNSTFSGNTAGDNGGGLFNFAGNVLITNSTFYDNIAGYNGSGILNNQEGTLVLKNSIVADDPGADTSLSGNCGGTITDGNRNIQFPESSCGKTITVADPLLAPLADNGGLTLTHALKTGSPAIDKGDQNVCQSDPVTNIDQRSLKRPIGSSCDIGAFEYDPTFKGPAEPTNSSNNTTCTCATPVPTRILVTRRPSTKTAVPPTNPPPPPPTNPPPPPPTEVPPTNPPPPRRVPPIQIVFPTPTPVIIN